MSSEQASDQLVNCQKNDPILNLKAEMEKYMLCELLAANQYVSKDTVLLRVFKKLTESLNISWSSLVDSMKTNYYVEPSLQNTILKCWNRHGSSANQCITADDQAVVERVVSRDYVRSTDLVKLATVLTKKCPLCEVSLVFGVDGHQSMDPKRYVENFKFSEDDFRGKHVRFVREMHRKIQNPERVCAVLKCAFDNFENGSLQETYLEDYDHITYKCKEEKLEKIPFGKPKLHTPLMDSNELEMLREYVDTLGYNNLDKVIDWKKKQAEADARINKCKKRCLAESTTTVNKQ